MTENQEHLACTCSNERCPNVSFVHAREDDNKPRCLMCGSGPAWTNAHDDFHDALRDSMALADDEQHPPRELTYDEIERDAIAFADMVEEN